MRVITITNQKGGVGKTTTAQHLGVGLKKMGKRVLFIDADQQTNLSFALNFNYNATIHDVMTKRISIKDAIYHTVQGDIIGGSFKLANAEKEFNETGREFIFRELLKEVSNDYDYVIIDTPPALGVITVNALTCSNDIIIPAQSDVFSLQGLSQLNNLVNQVKKYTNSDLRIAGILLTKYSNRTILGKNLKQTIENAGTSIGTKVFKSSIRDMTAIREAQLSKTNIFDYDKKSKVANDYQEFINEYLKDIKEI